MSSPCERRTLPVLPMSIDEAVSLSVQIDVGTFPRKKAASGPKHSLIFFADDVEDAGQAEERLVDDVADSADSWPSCRDGDTARVGISRVNLGGLGAMIA